MSAKTVCECIRMMRELKSKTLYDLYQVIKAPEHPHPLGIFGEELPEKDVVDDAISAVRAKVNAIVKNCPIAYEPDGAEYVKRLQKLLQTKTTEENYLDVAADVLEAAEGFTAAIVDGIAAKSVGFKKTKGPFSPDRYTRQACTAHLNNLESLTVEINGIIEEINAYMSPPEDLVNKAVELHNEQMSIIEQFLQSCKLDPGEIGEKLKAFDYEVKHELEMLKKYDEWTEQNWDKMTEEQRRDRISGRDHYLGNITIAIENSQKLVEAFTETIWQGECQVLSWR